MTPLNYFLLGIIIALIGVIFGIVMLEIRKLRVRTHKLEGAMPTLLNHLSSFNQWLTTGQNIEHRLTAIETSLEILVKVRGLRARMGDEVA